MIKEDVEYLIHRAISPLKDKIEELEEENKLLKKEINDLKFDNKYLKEEVTRLKTEIRYVRSNTMPDSFLY